MKGLEPRTDPFKGYIANPSDPGLWLCFCWFFQYFPPWWFSSKWITLISSALQFSLWFVNWSGGKTFNCCLPAQISTKKSSQHYQLLIKLILKASQPLNESPILNLLASIVRTYCQLWVSRTCHKAYLQGVLTLGQGQSMLWSSWW